MRVAVTGDWGKSALVRRIALGSFTLQLPPTFGVEITRVSMGGLPVAFIETKHVLACDLVLLLCSSHSRACELWRDWHGHAEMVVVWVTARARPYGIRVCSMSGHGIGKLISVLYLKALKYE